jgi:hypothetical protein
MNKVYFNKGENYWFVNEPEDFYSFKSLNYETNEEVKHIFSWTRGVDLEKYPHHIRMYDVEIEQVKYLFLMRKQDSIYIIESEDPQQLEKLINNHSIFFVGETMNS